MTAIMIPSSTSETADLHSRPASQQPTAHKHNNLCSTTTVATKSTPTGGRGRKAPYPNSVLDRRVLQQALDTRGLVVKPIHIEGFYQALHRQHYPDLPDFVEEFERYNSEAATRKSTKYSETAASDSSIVTPALNRKPIKNAVSRRKNRNRIQLPKAFLEFIKDPSNGLVTVTSNIAIERTSADGSTTKLAVQLHDGQTVESVLMRYVSHDGSRASLCVSSQCGCAMGCTFCATGTMGLSGNLTTGEILEQIVHADRILAREWESRKQTQDMEAKLNLDLVRNVVFMGMGEPLDNFSNVVEACRALMDRKRWNLAHGRVTVSTVGLTSQIRKLTRDLPEVSLALSLHAPNQEMRTTIVPTAKRYPIEDLIQALDEHMMAYLRTRRLRLIKEGKIVDGEYTAEERMQESGRRRAMIEYVMLEGPTSTFQAAHELGSLCKDRQLVVNLIPYNSTDVEDKLQCPSREHMEEFRRIVTSYGTFCTIRKTMGADIASACGQLITRKDKEKGTSTSPLLRDIEGNRARPALAASETQGLGQVLLLRKKSAGKADRPTAELHRHSNNLEVFIGPLYVATSIAAASFVVSTVLFLRKR